MSDIFAVDLPDFERLVLQESATTPVLVDFWADWCSPCLVIAPQLQRLIEERGGALKLAKVEVDEGENMKLAGRYKVRGFPTIMLFQQGEEIARFSGARARHWIEDWVDAHLRT